MKAKNEKAKRKKTGAWIAALVILVQVSIEIALLVWAATADELPVWLFLLILCIPVAIAVGVLAALRQRLREIEKGEEDEASEY